MLAPPPLSAAPPRARTGASHSAVLASPQGHPGMLLKSAPDPDARQPDSNGFLVSVGALPIDANGKAWGPMELTLLGAAEWCDRHQRKGEVRALHRLLFWCLGLQSWTRQCQDSRLFRLHESTRLQLGL